MKAVPQSKCTKKGFPKIENKLAKCFLTVTAETLAHRKGKGKYLSTTVNMKLLQEFEGNGPLKSTLNFSNG